MTYRPGEPEWQPSLSTVLEEEGSSLQPAGLRLLSFQECPARTCWSTLVVRAQLPGKARHAEYLLLGHLSSFQFPQGPPCLPIRALAQVCPAGGAGFGPQSPALSASPRGSATLYAFSGSKLPYCTTWVSRVPPSLVCLHLPSQTHTNSDVNVGF